MNEKNGTVDFVESVIDGMVENDMEVSDAVARVLDREEEGDTLPESVEINLEEGEDAECPLCHSKDLDFGVTETEDGGEIPTIHCTACDTGFLAEDEEEDEEEVLEGVIDEDDPHCPVCESDNLDGEIHEDDEGNETPLITCGDCGSGFVPVEEEV
jgi:DNA-directed RNA polymerase subunit M/transcription elongation factor TFIIS